MHKNPLSTSSIPKLLIAHENLSAIKVGCCYTQPCPPGSGDAWLIANLSRQLNKPIVVFTDTTSQAQRLMEEIILFMPGGRIQQFLDWETLPYDSFSPHQDLVSKRLNTLYTLIQKNVDILIVAVTTVLYRLVPPEFIAAHTFFFQERDKIEETNLYEQLLLANYTRVTQVTAPGQFCIRGGLIDLFPMGSVNPYRIDLFGDEIESIRNFDIDTQCSSKEPIKRIRILPGREFPMEINTRNYFRSRFRKLFEGNPQKSIPYKSVSKGIPFPGIEYYLPLFFKKTSTLFNYLTPETVIVTVGNIEKAVKKFTQDTDNRYRFLSKDVERPVLPPCTLFLNWQELLNSLKSFARLALTTESAHPEFAQLPSVAIDRRNPNSILNLSSFIQKRKNRILFCADSAGRAEILAKLLANCGVASINLFESVHSFIQSDAELGITVAFLTTGFVVSHLSLAFITEKDLYPESNHTTQRNTKLQERTGNIESIIRDLSEIHTGDPIVHIQHGVGRYRGLKNIDMGEGEIEFLCIEYSNESLLYVPISQMYTITRYSGASLDNAPLHSLGSNQWEKARFKAIKQIHDAAAELLDLYAQRASREGFPFKLPSDDYAAFVEGFGFDETPDQSAAIDAVIKDMASKKPMDRLVCGEVGFGKTEVALRAAFLSVLNKKQVVLLCPTTLLVEQHARTFTSRFANWPVRLAEFSRFRSAKDITSTIRDIEQGKVDIIIGTHKILSKKIRFRCLGLLIIDEEHRFGVRQKEVLKAFKSEVDILALTATPIPRTLGLSLEGVRDFSVISTAPQKRLAIKTLVRREDNSVIREAILRELQRGGQTYFLHNEVETIHNRKAQLNVLVPEIRIAVAHGQMPERELEEVMKGYYQKRYDMLLCTTIIETGIDVPNANTILIHRADRFGLAQLHQLRGRVGRSYHQAYAYLLIPSEDNLNLDAKKRLEAIQAMEELGSGFYLAMHDLEIRGAGEILGESQSGNIQEIGFSMYNDMLKKTVTALQKGIRPHLETMFSPACEINVHAPALLPHCYCPDVQTRLSIYNRLACAIDQETLLSIREELVDRFGLLPSSVQTLVDVHKIRLLAQKLGIIKIDVSEKRLSVQFDKESTVSSERIIKTLQEYKNCKLADRGRILFEIPGTDELQSRLNRAEDILRLLGK